MFTRPDWAEVSRHHLLENFRQLRTAAGESAELMAVLKANAYGHGVLECAPLLAAAGAGWFGVTCVEEGMRLRAVCPEARIAIMGGMWRGEAEAIIEHRLTPFVWEPFHLEMLETAVRTRGLAAQSLSVHLEMETGMARQGVPAPATAASESPSLEAMLGSFAAPGSSLKLEAVTTHFASAEVLDSDQNERQIARLEAAVERVLAHKLHPEWISAGSSATLLAGRPVSTLRTLAAKAGARWMVRPGIALYGYPPRLSGDTQAEAVSRTIQESFRPVLAWKTRVNSLRTIEAGETAGYNATFVAKRRTRLALLPIGYADGVNRLLSNRGSVLVRGKRATIAGRVSMDQTILDVTGIDGVEIGDEAVLIGEQGDERITALEIADMIGTIPYEVLCAITARVPRIMVD